MREPISSDVTVIDHLHERLTAHPEQRLRFVSSSGAIEVRTYLELHGDVSRQIARLRGCGIAAGDFVGIVGPNSYEWVVADLALLTLGCISVAFPVEMTAEPVDASALVAQYELSALLVSRAAPVRGADASPETAWLEEPSTSFVRREPVRRPALGQDVFTVAFSSGTTGVRKGLMLTRTGVEQTIQISARAWRVGTDDDILVVLPFSSFQQRYLVYLALGCGAGATVLPPEQVFQRLKAFEPTIVLGPPSFFEIVANRIKAAGRGGRLSYILASVLHAALPRASRRLRAWLGRRWIGMYGSRVRLMLTGSAPVSPRLLRTLRRVGAPLQEVYGSTESGWIAFSGRPVDGVSVELDADGTIVVKTRAAQAIGYVFEGVETHAVVFRPDGGIVPGDIGRMDRSGRLQVVGRSNNVIVTRSGVKVNPEELEEEIERACQIERAFVCGRPEGTGLCCIAWLSDDDPDRRDSVQAAVAQSNTRREASRRIDELIFRDAGELTAECGLLTRNLKLDRDAVRRRILREPQGVR